MQYPDKSGDDDDDEKEVIIIDLRQKLKELQGRLDVANQTIDLLNEEIFREKTINNKLLRIPPPVFHATQYTRFSAVSYANTSTENV